MARNPLYINGTEGIAPGAISTTNIPTGPRYHLLKLIAKAKTTAAGNAALTDVTQIIEWVRLIVNGIVMWDVTAADLIALAKTNDIDPKNNELPLYFSEPKRASILGEEATSWDTANGARKITLEIKWKQAIQEASLRVMYSADYSRNITTDANGKQVPYLSVFKVFSQNWNFGAGTSDIVNLPIQKPIQRLFLIPSAGTIESVEITKDGERIFELTQSDNEMLLADYSIRANAFGAGSFPFLPDHEQQISSALMVSKDLNVKVKLSEAASVRALIVQRVNGWV